MNLNIRIFTFIFLFVLVSYTTQSKFSKRNDDIFSEQRLKKILKEFFEIDESKCLKIKNLKQI